MSSRKSGRTLMGNVLSFLNTDGTMDANAVGGALYAEIAREMRDFFEEIPGGFFMYDAADEIVLYANKALLDIFACDTYEEFRQLTGGSFRGMVMAEDLADVEESIKLQISVNGNNCDAVEYRIKDKNGNTRWVEDYGHFVTDPIVGDIFYVFLTDATEKKIYELSARADLINENAAKELEIKKLIKEYADEREITGREQLRRLEVIEGLSANYETILYINLDNDSVFPYRLSSRTVSQFEGKFQERKYSWFFEDYIKTWVHPDDREQLAQVLNPAYIREKLVQCKTYYSNFRCVKDGETFLLQIRLVNVGAPDKVSQFVIGCRNVDEEIKREMENNRLLEDALKIADKADKAKNIFLSNMSHDMRTPLNAVFGYTELAKKNVDNPELISDYLQKIENASGQILDLVDKVLELSYIQSKNTSVDEKPCNLVEIMRDVENGARHTAENKGLKFSADYNVEHTDVVTDRVKILQMLNHLVSNAVKFTDKGSVNLAVKETHQFVNGCSEYKFTVKDTGIGISEDILSRIYEPFERERNTTSSGIFGIGLGLTLAKNTVDALGGNIDIKSKVGLGSTFEVTLKLRIRTDEPSALDTQQMLDGINGYRILLVEDNELNREIETEIFEDLGFAVDTAENGKISVEMVKSAPPDRYQAILMDIQMPVMDGREAAEKIRALDSERADIPIIALSANAFESDKIASIKAGMDAHLNKPIDVPVILETIATCIVAHKNKNGNR